MKVICKCYGTFCSFLVTETYLNSISKCIQKSSCFKFKLMFIVSAFLFARFLYIVYSRISSFNCIQYKEHYFIHLLLNPMKMAVNPRVMMYADFLMFHWLSLVPQTYQRTLTGYKILRFFTILQNFSSRTWIHFVVRISRRMWAYALVINIVPIFNLK